MFLREEKLNNCIKILFKNMRDLSSLPNAFPKALPVKKIIQETDNVKTFIFEYDLGAEPGQFVNMWLPGVDEKPMSVAYCDKNEFWVSIFAVGPFSSAMHELKVGDKVGVRGPYGRGFTWKKGEHLVMMAGGYGAAPLYYLTRRAVSDGCTVEFVIGARSKSHVLYTERIETLKNVFLHVATSDGSMGVKGYNTLILKQLIEDAKRGKSFREHCGNNTCEREEVDFAPLDTVYSCGPEMMMKSVAEMCLTEGVESQVSVERYMKCGFGVCGQCSVDGSGKRMCSEGPCMRGADALMIEEFGKYHRDAEGKIHEF